MRAYYSLALLLGGALALAGSAPGAVAGAGGETAVLVLPDPAAAGARRLQETESETMTSTPTRSAVSRRPSPTATRSISETQTGTPSPTRSPSDTASASTTASGSDTASVSASPSSSGSETLSSSITPSNTPSPSVTPTSTVSTGATTTGTNTASCTASRSATATLSVSGSSTRSATRSRSGTPSASGTGSGSGSGTGSPSPSATGSDTPSGTAPATRSRSGTRSSTPTPSATPSASIVWPLWTSSLVVTRLGDAPGAAPSGRAPLTTSTVPPGGGLPVYFDYLDVGTGRRWLTVPVPASAPPAGGSGDAAVNNPCTLAYGNTSAGSVDWFWESEGVPASSVNGAVVALPCHASPAGSRRETLLADRKTVAVLRANGRVDTTALFTGYTGLRGTATGLKTVASTRGESFWLAGVADRTYGVRFLESLRATTTRRIMGAVAYPDGHYQPGTIDARSVHIFSGGLFMSSSFVNEPNRNGEKAPFQPWGGLVRVGEPGSIPRNSSGVRPILALGFGGRRNYAGFALRDASNLWALEDICTYRRVSVADAQAQVPRIATRGSDDPGWRFVPGGDVTTNGWNPSRPTLSRSDCGTAVVRWRWSRETNRWQEDAANKVYFREVLTSLVGRSEPNPAATTGTEYVLYAAGRRAVYRVRPEVRGLVSTVATAAAGTLFRGVALPPDWRALVTPTRSPSRAASRSAAATRSRSGTKSAKPRA